MRLPAPNRGKKLATLIVVIGLYAMALEIFLIGAAAVAWGKQEEEPHADPQRRVLLKEEVRTRDMALACAPFSLTWIGGLWLLRRRRPGG